MKTPLYVVFMGLAGVLAGMTLLREALKWAGDQPALNKPPLRFVQAEKLGGGPNDECTWRMASPNDCLWDGFHWRKPSGPPIKVTKLPDRFDFGAGSTDYLSVISDGLDGGKICLRAEVATNVVYGNGLLGTDGPLEFCFAR